MAKGERVDVHIKVSTVEIKREALSKAVLAGTDLGRVTEALWKLWLNGKVRIPPELLDS